MSEATRQSLQSGYDAVAAEYARKYFQELDHKPLDRQLLDLFCAEVKGRGLVVDLGCGPGEVARYLYDHGLTGVQGIDLSPEMLRQASLLSPMIPFQTGDMLALQAADASWAGVAAFYSIIHIPRDQVPDALREIHRVLMPGGVLLLSIHIGEKVIHLDEFFGQKVSLDFIFYQPAEMEQALRQAGFERIEIIERDPYPEVEYQGRRAYLFARKPVI